MQQFQNYILGNWVTGTGIEYSAIHAITGKEAPQRVLEIAQYIGIVLLLGLMLYANGNDLVKWLFP